jgi:hypothetical protein
LPSLDINPLLEEDASPPVVAEITPFTCSMAFI